MILKQKKFALEDLEKFVLELYYKGLKNTKRKPKNFFCRLLNSWNHNTYFPLNHTLWHILKLFLRIEKKLKIQNKSPGNRLSKKKIQPLLTYLLFSYEKKKCFKFCIIFIILGLKFSLYVVDIDYENYNIEHFKFENLEHFCLYERCSMNNCEDLIAFFNANVCFGKLLQVYNRFEKRTAFYLLLMPIVTKTESISRFNVNFLRLNYLVISW